MTGATLRAQSGRRHLWPRLAADCDGLDAFAIRNIL